MYSLKNFLTKTPIEIASTATGVLNVGELAEWWNLGEKTIGGINTAASLVLGLFVGKMMTSKAESDVQVLQGIQLGKVIEAGKH